MEKKHQKEHLRVVVKKTKIQQPKQKAKVIAAKPRVAKVAKVVTMPKKKRKLVVKKKEEPKPSIGKKLTGLSKEEMNKLSPLELFGKLPVSVSKIVLKPSVTGVKVASQLNKKRYEEFNENIKDDYRGQVHNGYRNTLWGYLGDEASKQKNKNKAATQRKLAKLIRAAYAKTTPSGKGKLEIKGLTKRTIPSLMKTAEKYNVDFEDAKDIYDDYDYFQHRVDF